ncbi:MAG: hypothetical protein M0Q15_15835 [Nevskia sp.]|jgi:hypothetical protein|nr:hypothetical protein [Nevskia sp.]
MSTDYSYIGKGKWHAKVVGAAAAPIEVGNVSAASFSVEEETKSQLDYTSAGGGERNAISRITGVALNLTATDYSPENFAKLLRASVTAVAAAAVTGEAVAVYATGGLARFASMPATTPAPAVVTPGAAAATRVDSDPMTLDEYYVPAVANGFYYKVTTAGTTAATPPTFDTTIGGTTVDGTATVTCAGKTALVSGTDYNISGSGLSVVADVSIDGELWTVGYTKAVVDNIQALVETSKEYEFTFEGLNEARSGKRSNILVHRVTLSPAQQMALISDDYGALEVVGKVLQDTTKNGTTLSQYFAVELER